MNRTRLITTLFGSLATALLFAPFAMTTAVAQTPPAHVMESAAAAKWGPAPPMLPPGAQIAVLAGNPTTTGRYTVRLKFPANYDIPAHSHPEDENVVVVSGELFMGLGTKMDKKALDALAAACSAACRPIDDKRGTREYRIKVAGVLARRAAQIARKRAGGK